MIPEMLVALWLAMGFDFFLSRLEQSERGEQPSLLVCWGLAATMALNVLTKGLIGLVFPIGTIFLYLLLTKNLRHLLRLRLFSSFLVFLAIAAPWHLLAGFRNPAQGEARGFFWFYFVNEHFLRFLKKRFPADYDTVPLWLFWGLDAGMADAVDRVHCSGGTAGPGKIGGVPRRPERAATRNADFCFVAAGDFAVLQFLQPAGILRAARLAGSGAAAGRMAGARVGFSAGQRRAAQRKNFFDRAGSSGRSDLCCMRCAGVASAQTPPANYDIAELLKKNPQDYALSFGHILDLTPQAMGAFKVPLLATGFAFALGTILNFVLRRRNRAFAANLALTIMTMVLLYATHQALVIFSPVLSSKVLADAIESNWKPGAIIEDNGDYEAASSVNYYTRRQIRILNGRCNNIWYGSKFPDAPPIFDDNASFERLWRGANTVFLLTDAKARPSSERESPTSVRKKMRLPDYVVKAWKTRACVLAKWGGKLVLTNGPKPCPDQAWPR